MKRQTGSEPSQTARVQSPLIYYHSRIIFTEKKNRIPAVFLFVLKEVRNEVILIKRIFRWIKHSFGAIEGNILHAQVREDGKQRFPAMCECYRAMMRISLFNQYVAVKTSHFRYGKYADAAKAPCPNRQDLSLRDVGFHLSASRTLQPEEGNLTRSDIPFKRAARKARLVPVFQQTIQNQLVFDRSFGKLAQRSIPAMETHKDIL